MRTLLLLLALAAGPAIAQDRCLLACDEETTGAAAAARLEAILGGPLPSGTMVAGLVEGGFQDAFIQARLEVAWEDAPALLARLGVGVADLADCRGEALGPTGPAWWDVQAQGELDVAPAAVRGFAHAMVGMVRRDGAYSLYLWAFQT